MFITLEGMEGVGKTTLAERLSVYFKGQGKAVCVTREPGGCSLGEKLRPILLNSQAPLTMESELFLFLADRAQHVAEYIRPALAEGKVVICDRYLDSTMVYQGYGRGFEIEKLWDMNMFAAKGLLPEKTFVLDMAPEKALQRALKRSSEVGVAFERFESENLDFHRRIREGFLVWSKRNASRIEVLNAEEDSETLFQQARVALLS